MESSGYPSEGYLKGITESLHGDRSAAEIARILRVPGTFNYKYGDKILVTLRDDNGLRYNLHDFDNWHVEVSEAAKRSVEFSEAPTRVDIDRFNLSGKIKDLILKGWEGNAYKSRSEADMAVITALLSSRATEDEIRAVFQSCPIGKKYQEKGGAGDQYLAHSIGAATTYLSAQKKGNSFLPTPPLYTPEESEEVKTALIWAKDVPPPKEGEEIESLWGPFLFPSSLHTMAGDAGLGKTTLLYNIAIRMARGEEFGGFKPPRPLRVLYYDFETPDLLFKRKLHLISENSPPEGLAFARSFHASEALALAKEHNFDLIIIDTLNEAFETKDEGDNAEANRQMRELRRIVKDSGAAIVALSHMGKDPSAKGVYKLRGASARPAAADVVLNVETYSDDVICLEVAKNRWVGGVVKLFLRKAGEDQFEVAEVAGENTATAEKQIREYIASIIPYETATIKTQEILTKAVESGFQRGTTEKVLSRMSQVGGGGVKRKKRGVYTRTKAGVEAPDPSFRLPGGIGKSDSEEVQKEAQGQCQTLEL